VQPAEAAVGDAVVRHVVTFGRILREAGLEVGPGRLADALNGLDVVDIGNRQDVYWTLRSTLVSRREELDPFDRAFAAWFLRDWIVPPPSPRPPEMPPVEQAEKRGDSRVLEGAEEDEDGETSQLGWSAVEVLRGKDFAGLSSEELAEVKALIASLTVRRPTRRSRRLRPHSQGRTIDLRRLARASLATGGEPIERAFRRRVRTPRKLVVLCDVSGSMEAYTRPLLLFLHAAVGSGRGVEAFAFGTRLTRLTNVLKTRDPEQALDAAAESVVDWASGTRIGACLKEFNDEWGRRALTRGAIVVIVSDGWERDDADLVGREMTRLARAAYAVIWVNPLKGNPQYQPLAGGMKAALPHVDRFLSGHNVASLERLGDVLARIERRHAA
jgi:uncharacterized protein with von Willebrand factor type A (vWA) domain